jgi:hypothetical protein
MKRLMSVVLVIGALVAPSTTLAAGNAGQRPFSDWLDAQQAVLDPSVAVELGPISWYEPASGENIMADMDGRVAAWVTANGGSAVAPIITGTVIERVLPDGRAEVRVNLTFRNAITYVWLDLNDFADFPNGPELFGYRASEIADGASATLGDGSFRITFLQPEPGAPLPELAQLAFAPTEGQEIISVAFHAQALGPLREASGYAEGTPGMGATQQIGVFQASTPDGYPVEWVTVKPVGN